MRAQPCFRAAAHKCSRTSRFLDVKLLISWLIPYLRWLIETLTRLARLSRFPGHSCEQWTMSLKLQSLLHRPRPPAMSIEYIFTDGTRSRMLQTSMVWLSKCMASCWFPIWSARGWIRALIVSSAIPSIVFFSHNVCKTSPRAGCSARVELCQMLFNKTIQKTNFHFFTQRFASTA